MQHLNYIIFIEHVQIAFPIHLPVVVFWCIILVLIINHELNRFTFNIYYY